VTCSISQFVVLPRLSSMSFATTVDASLSGPTLDGQSSSAEEDLDLVDGIPISATAGDPETKDQEGPGIDDSTDTVAPADGDDDDGTGGGASRMKDEGSGTDDRTDTAGGDDDGSSSSSSHGAKTTTNSVPAVHCEKAADCTDGTCLNLHPCRSCAKGTKWWPLSQFGILGTTAWS